jgi:hypothetical protein
MGTFTKKFDTGEEFTKYCQKMEVNEVFHNRNNDEYLAVPPERLLTTLVFHMRTAMIPPGWSLDKKNGTTIRRHEDTKRDVLKILHELDMPEDAVRRFKDTKIERNTHIHEDEHGSIHIYTTEKGVHFEFRTEGAPELNIVAEVSPSNEKKIRYTLERDWSEVIKLERGRMDAELKAAKIEIWHGTLSRGHSITGDVDCYDED